MCDPVSVPPVCWSRPARCHVTGVRKDTQERIVRGEDDSQNGPPIKNDRPSVDTCLSVSPGVPVVSMVTHKYWAGHVSAVSVTAM